MRRTNKFASNRNVIKNGAHALCEADSYVGNISEDSGEITVGLDGIISTNAFSAFSIVATDANGTEFGQSYTAQEFFDNFFNLTLDVTGGVSPYQVEFRAIPAADCSCALIVKAEVATGETVFIDQALAFSPDIVFQLETDTPDVFVDTNLGRSEETTIDRTPESISEGAVVERKVRLKNKGNVPLFVYAGFLGGDITGNTITNAPVFAIPPGQTLELGEYTLDTVAAGSKSLDVVLYTNSVGSKTKQITIDYTVS